jgi:glycosyltransferase involved in cell wall biosynthesis
VKVLFYVDTGGSTGGPGMHTVLVYRAFQARYAESTGPFAHAASDEDYSIFTRQLGRDAVVPLASRSLDDGAASTVVPRAGFYRALCDLAHAHGCDHIHVLWGFVHPAQIAEVPPAERVPVTITLCDATGRGEDDDIDAMYFGSDRWERYLREALQTRAGYLSISEKTRRDAIAKGVPASQVETHYLWVDRKIAERRVNDPEDYVAFVGGLADYKGVSHVLDLALLYPEYRIKVAGYPFEDFPIDFGRYPSIEYLGYLPSYEDVITLIARARALLYLSYSEGFGLPMIEAQLVGTPLIVNPKNRMVQELLPRGSYVAAGNVASPSNLKVAIDVATRDRSLLVARGLENAARFEEGASVTAMMRAMAEAHERQRTQGMLA